MLRHLLVFSCCCILVASARSTDVSTAQASGTVLYTQQESTKQQETVDSSVDRQEAIVNAAEANDLETLIALLPVEDQDVNQSQPDGMTALHWASVHGSEKMVERLVEAGANVNVLNSYDVSPLSLAAERGYSSIIRCLVDAGANVEAARAGKERPLMLAVRNGDRESVEILLEANAEIDAKESRGQTALMWAAAAGNEEAVDALIIAGADSGISTGKSGFTPLLFAAREGQIAVVERLIRAGVDVNSAIETERSGGRNPRNGMSGVMLAIESGHLELALRLVELGADPNDQRSGYAPLHAISWVRKTKRGDDPDGDPPPRITGQIQSLTFVRMLIEAGAEVNLQLEKGKSGGKAKLTPKGATPFLFASIGADVPLMNVLLEAGADPLIANEDGCNALMAAAGVGVVAVGEEPGTEEEVCDAISLLVESGVDVNVVDANGETAMHGAAYRNFPLVVSLLHELGADPQVWNSRNRYGWTPRDIATGKRPGSVKPSQETIDAIDRALNSSR